MKRSAAVRHGGSVRALRPRGPKDEKNGRSVSLRPCGEDRRNGSIHTFVLPGSETRKSLTVIKVGKAKKVKLRCCRCFAHKNRNCSRIFRLLSYYTPISPTCQEVFSYFYTQTQGKPIQKTGHNPAYMDYAKVFLYGSVAFSYYKPNRPDAVFRQICSRSASSNGSFMSASYAERVVRNG